MKLARSRRRALVALASLAAVASAPARAADDKSTPSAVMELFGYSSDPSAASIDYRERPKLVLPPQTGRLPEPKIEVSQPEGWPTDAAGARRRNSDRFARIPNAPPPQEERKSGSLSWLWGGAASADAGKPDLEEPSRRMLSDPPPGYRRPSKDLRSVTDPEPAKKGAWWNPVTALGKPSAWNPLTYIAGGVSGRRIEDHPEETPAQQKQKPQAQQQQQQQQQQANGSDSEGWFHMPRFVLKDPEKE